MAWVHAICVAIGVLLLAVAGHPVQDCVVRFEDNDRCACSSQDPHGPVKCLKDNHSIEIQPCYCMYFDQQLNMTIVGHCLFSCYQFSRTILEITTSIDLNDDICNKKGSEHHIGRFCGQCNESYGLDVYSYQYLSCVPCKEYGYKNWLTYFAVTLLPLTLFYVLAVLMSCNVTSSSYSGLVLVSQCLHSFSLLLSGIEYNPLHRYYNLVFGSIYGILNLDLFRGVYRPFCLHPKATIFEVLSLEYVVALYPFLLILVTYGLVIMYDRGYRILVWMWRPFQICIRRYRRTWDIRTSLVEIFATFILLSSAKILWLSFHILAYNPTYSVAGRQLHYYLTLYDGNIKYFGSQHLPFALLAIAIISIFVLFPLLLLVVYPCGCFHKCLNRCGFACQTLHVFMDAFQGSYRTEPRDMRYFSAFYLLLRVLILAQVQIFKTALLFYTSGVLALSAAAVIALFQPYKVSSHNKVDSILLVLMGIDLVSIHEMSLLSTLKYTDLRVLVVIQNMSATLLNLSLLSMLTWKLLRLKTVVPAVVRKLKATCNAAKNGDLESYPPLLEESRRSDN